MRTADQVKRKYYELATRLQALQALLADTEETTRPALQTQTERLEEQMLLLEWVINEPIGSYHG